MAPRYNIDVKTYGKIKTGMSQADVERLIGAPPGDYSSTGLLPGWETKGLQPRPGATVLGWGSDDVSIRVVFSDNGEVEHADIRFGCPRRPGLLERIWRK
jgi:hypothetical protein